MEEAEDGGAGVRKRKRDGEVAGSSGAGVRGGGEAGLDGGGGCFSWDWKELGLVVGEKEKEKEGEECEGIAEESVEEVMRWLEMEICGAAGKGGGGCAEDDGFVTINGNEESCGPSFSAAASTVMASVDTRAGAPPPPTPIPWPWPEPEPDAARDDQAKAAAADELEEEWLLDLLTAGGPALEVFSLE